MGYALKITLTTLTLTTRTRDSLSRKHIDNGIRYLGQRVRFSISVFQLKKLPMANMNGTIDHP